MNKKEKEHSLVEQQYRVEALGHAVRHRLTSETPDNIVKAAEKYLAFLQGTK